MKRFPTGRWLVTLVALVTLGGAYVADWNVTHIFNPRWPPHAKFHNAQTMLFGSLLGALSLWFLWGQRGEARATFRLGALFAGLYWVAQAGAILFPGTALVDPEYRHPGQLPGQLILDALLGSLLALGYWLEINRLPRRPLPG